MIPKARDLMIAFYISLTCEYITQEIEVMDLYLSQTQQQFKPKKNQ